MAENRIDVEMLKDENPWKELIERIEENNYRPLDENYAFNHDDLNLLKSISNEKCRIHLEILPSHYTGNILDAKAVIFALNPGYDEKEEKNGFYYDPDINKIRIQHLKFDYKYFFPVDPKDRDKWENLSPYWYHGLKPLWENEKDEDKVFKKVAQNVALLQLFPYHSKEWCDRFLNLDLKTLEYTTKLARYCVQEGKIIIVARGEKHWFNLVKDLKSYTNLYTLSNPRTPSISPNNIENNKFAELKDKILSE